MELRKIRFNQNWGIACGPVCGDTSVECMFYDDMKHSFFVYVSILDMGLLLGISKVSIFDIMNNNAGDFEAEIEKAKSYCNFFQDYDTEMMDEEKEDFDDFGIYKDAVMATLNVLHSYLASDDTDAIIKQWAGKELQSLDCSYHPFFEDEENEDEES